MTTIHGSSPIGAAAPAGASGAPDAAGAARAAMGEIGGRILAWSGQVFGGGGGATATWARLWGVEGGSFRPSAAELGRGGDVYGLRPLAAEIAGRFGAGPAAEGELLRAAEGFARAAALHIYGLAGAPPERQLATVAEALDAGTEGGGIDAVTARIESAARRLEAAS